MPRGVPRDGREGMPPPRLSGHPVRVGPFTHELVFHIHGICPPPIGKALSEVAGLAPSMPKPQCRYLSCQRRELAAGGLGPARPAARDVCDSPMPRNSFRGRACAKSVLALAVPKQRPARRGGGGLTRWRRASRARSAPSEVRRPRPAQQPRQPRAKSRRRCIGPPPRLPLGHPARRV